MKTNTNTPADNLSAFYAWRAREAADLARRCALLRPEHAEKALASVIANARMPAPRVVIVPVDAL